MLKGNIEKIETTKDFLKLIRIIKRLALALSQSVATERINSLMRIIN